jgi:hypothetical protein
MKKINVYKIYAKGDFDEIFCEGFSTIRIGMPLPALFFMKLRCHSKYY